MYQMPFIYQHSRHLSVHCVQLLEMKLLYIKIQKHQEGAVTFFSPGLHIYEEGQLDTGRGRAGSLKEILLWGLE